MDNAASSLTGLFCEEGSFGVFILVTVILGGGAAWLAGRAVAATWRPWWQVVAYALILGLAVRFIHFSLFNGTLLSLHYYLVDSAFCMALATPRAPKKVRIRPMTRASPVLCSPCTFVVSWVPMTGYWDRAECRT